MSNPHPQPPVPQGPGAPAPAGNYASWGLRAGAFLIDYAIALPGLILMMIGYFSYVSSLTESLSSIDPETGAMTQPEMATLPWTFWVGWLIMMAIMIWNYCYKQGTTGQSIGKKVVGTKLISEKTGQPIGFGMAFVRYIAHTLDSLPCYIGFLWPLWDAKRQTFADKILSTVVIQVPKG